MGFRGIDASAVNANGASVINIAQSCNNDQLLVSLSKNSSQWLSPVGWTDQQKVTLLDCRSKGETTEIDIPAEFARDIKTGDVLVLRCSELDFETEITWEKSEVETRAAKEVAPSATGLTGGLFSRFKGAKTDILEEVKSEAELRAEEADRAARSYKAKMEAAAAAREEAQRKALEAAREAEAALKMEAERIAEMERAAKAFEEAERLKQDELRRVEEERRAEEARITEEARRIEEARKREIAAKKEAERKAALERYESALEITRDEESQLKSRLKELKRKAKSESSNLAVQQDDLQSRQGDLFAFQETVEKRSVGYEKSAAKLGELTANLTALQAEADRLAADREALTTRVSQADTAYEQAQKEAEAAIAKAEARRAELDLIRQEEHDLSGKILSISEQLPLQSQLISETAEATEKLQAKLEAAEAKLTQSTLEIEALEQSLAVQDEQDKSLRLEIEVTQNAIEDIVVRKAAHQDAIEHLRLGGDVDNIAEVNFEARHFETPQNFVERAEAPAPLKDHRPARKNGMIGRMRRSLKRENDAQISIDVEDVVLEAADKEVDPVLFAGIDDQPSFLGRHGSSLTALGAVIGGIAILGGGLALNKSAPEPLAVKKSPVAPTQVASAVTKIEPPKVEVSMNKPVVFEKPVKAAVKAENAPIAEPAKSETDAFAVKLAAVTDPKGFAFELPEMLPTVEEKAVATAPPPQEKKSAKVTPKKLAKKVEPKRSKPVQKTTVKKAKPKALPKRQAEANYPELTADIQTRLFKLGFYNGEITGLQSQDTKKAIQVFKTIHAMSDKSGNITGAFLSELKRAEREQKASQLAAQAEAAARVRAEQASRASQAYIQVADATPSRIRYETVQPVPSTPVLTDTLPAPETFVPVNEAAPTYIASEPETVKVAAIASSITQPAAAPAIEDNLVPARVLKGAAAKYPAVALRRNYFVDVAIEVGYDIDMKGRPVNLRILSNDHEGKFNPAFEKEALKAIAKMRYQAQRLNGKNVVARGNKKRIVFRTE